MINFAGIVLVLLKEGMEMQQQAQEIKYFLYSQAFADGIKTQIGI